MRFGIYGWALLNCLLMRYSLSQFDLEWHRTRFLFCQRHTCGLMGEVGAYHSVDWHMLFVRLLTAPQSALSWQIAVGYVAILCSTYCKLICAPRSCAIEAKRRLIADDPAHARPQRRGLRCLSPVNRPRACAQLLVLKNITLHLTSVENKITVNVL